MGKRKYGGMMHALPTSKKDAQKIKRWEAKRKEKRK